MHVIAIATRAVLCGSVISLPGCVGIKATKHTYDAAASSPAAQVNGSSIRMQVKPEGAENGSYAISAMVVSAVVGTMDGPFRWRLEATGTPDLHESLVIHRIRTKTGTTKRDEWYPANLLGKRADFQRKKGDSGPVRAVYEIPGQLRVKPREDGPLDIWVDLSVVSRQRTQRRTVHFRLEPAQKRADEFIFLPAEIVQSIGTSPADWGNEGWD